MQTYVKFVLVCMATIFSYQTTHALQRTHSAHQRPLNITNAIANNYDIAYLVKNGLDLNAQDSEGNTLLHVACQLGECAIIAKILDYPQVDLNKQNHFGITPLYALMALRADKEASMNNVHNNKNDYRLMRDALNLGIACLTSKGAVDNSLNDSLEAILNHENRLNEEQKKSLKNEISSCYRIGKLIVNLRNDAQ